MWCPAGVCCQELAAQGHHHRREEVHGRLHTAPTEQQQSEKARLEKEGEDALGRQGTAEHVAHEPRVGRPVRPELELHHDARGHPDGEDQTEDPYPELRHLLVHRVTCPQIRGLHGHQKHPEPDAQGWENVVHHDGEGELHAREQIHIHDGPSGGDGKAELR
jgi:hypothetical protein